MQPNDPNGPFGQIGGQQADPGAPYGNPPYADPGAPFFNPAGQPGGGVPFGPAGQPMEPGVPYGQAVYPPYPPEQEWIQNGAYPPLTPEQIQQMQYEAYMQAQGGQPPMPPQMPPIQPNPYNQPGMKVKKQKKPGQRSPVKRLLLAALVTGLLGGGAYYLSQYMNNRQAATAVIESAAMGASYQGDALIVRNETAFDDEGVQSIDYVAQEGSVVYRGDPLCYVYSTGYSAAEITALQDYRDQINDYQQSLLAGETAFDQRMERLENDVLERGMEVRSLVQGIRGNLINQEQILETAITQRQNYFRSKYASDMRLQRLYDDESTQEQRIESWIKQKVATQESIVSFYTDGFEYALSPTVYMNYTPSQVRAMINGEKPETTTAERGRTDLYRLVKQDNYAVLLLVRNSTWSPKDGDTFTLELEQFSSTKVNAQVKSSSRSGSDLLVRLAVLGDVSDVLYMRTCQARIGENVDCMAVPSAALYTQNEARGVVIITEGQQLFVPVNVLREEKGKAYIAAVQTGILTAGMTVRLFH